MKSVGKGIRIAVVVLCAAVFLVCAGMMIHILIGYARDQHVNDGINQGFETLSDLSQTDRETLPTEEEKTVISSAMNEEMKKQYEYLMELKATYPDVVGYVSIPSVSINYPVVQTTNNRFYLDHLITGEEGSSGTIFLDYRCNANAGLSKNSVLYGHNMNNRTMFHNIELLFSRQTFLDSMVEYITEDGVYIYKPLSVYKTNTADNFDQYQFADDEAFLAYCEERADKSRFEESRDVLCTADSGIITFVTCTNSITDKTERYIYQAVLERVYLPEN